MSQGTYPLYKGGGLHSSSQAPSSTGDFEDCRGGSIPWEAIESARANPVWMGVIASLLAFSAMTVVFLLSNDLLKTLRAFSGKFRTLSLDAGTLVVLLSLSSVLAIAVGVVLFSRAKGVFLFFLLGSFAVSDALLPGISEASLAIRYLCILLLVSLALCVMPSIVSRGINTIQIWGLLYLAWQVAGLFINGYDLPSLLMLPVQVALFWGILLGLSTEFDSQQAYRRFALVVGWTGVLLTAFHLSSFALSPQPFLAGRFRSYYALPTNFANGYAIFVIAMLWLGLRGERTVARIAAGGGVLAGIAMLVLSGTRNSILSIAVGILVFAAAWPRRIATAGILATIFIGLVLVTMGDAFPGLEGIFNRFSKVESSTRQEVWALTWRYIAERPVVGYGIGKAGDVLGETLQSWEKAEFINTHNAYLGIWLQHGIIGLSLVLVLMGTGLIKGFRTLYAKTTDGWVRDSLALPLSMFAALAAGGMFEEYLTSRGSVQQITWGMSLMLIMNAASASRAFLDLEEDANE